MWRLIKKKKQLKHYGTGGNYYTECYVVIFVLFKRGLTINTFQCEFSQ